MILRRSTSSNVEGKEHWDKTCLSYPFLCFLVLQLIAIISLSSVFYDLLMTHWYMAVDQKRVNGKDGSPVVTRPFSQEEATTAEIFQ